MSTLLWKVARDICAAPMVMVSAMLMFKQSRGVRCSSMQIVKCQLISADGAVPDDQLYDRSTFADHQLAFAADLRPDQR